MIFELMDMMDNIINTHTEFKEQDMGGGTPMKKWDSGVVRGVGNQIGNTKWSDINTINRGKSNPLW